MEQATSQKKKNPFDNSDSRRLVSLQKCAGELKSRYSSGPAGMRALCQPMKLWSVSAETRGVVAESLSLTFACGLGPATIDFLSNNTPDDTHFVIELLDATGKSQSRFLVQHQETTTAIRGFYVVRTRILSSVPANPVGVIFNRGHFSQESSV